MGTTKVIQLKEFNGEDYNNLVLDGMGAQVSVTVVGAENGIQVTATQGSYIQSATTDNNGKAVFYLGYGDWVFSCTGATRTASLTINTYASYAVSIAILNGLEGATWEQIKTAAKNGTAPNIWSIGDVKSIVLSGEVAGRLFNDIYYIYIIGFNHRINSDYTSNGAVFQGFKNKDGTSIALIGKDTSYQASLDDAFVMGPNTGNSTTKCYGWEKSYMRETIMPKIKQMLPDEFVSILTSYNYIYTDNTGDGTPQDDYVYATTDIIYLLSEYEVFGACENSNPAEANYQAQFEYYANGNSKIKYMDNDTTKQIAWWLRSPAMWRKTPRIICYCGVRTDGGEATTSPSLSQGCAPVFPIW